ncbi:response regulator [Fibrisoma montanum]|uniref:Response regulator n=1 Tax=Fibrisoma montanum TaxID=2305895 RepID=A0A418M1B8_9BACT|nr:response regulator [Fibrisoma montanum]RIV19403.1 response regulator [Fibrisoma montanum]
MSKKWIALLDGDEEDLFIWNTGINWFANELELKSFIDPNEFLVFARQLANGPSLIIIDGIIPRGDELYWLSKIKTTPFQTVPIIMLGGDEIMLNKEQFTRAGATDCVYKPSSFKELQNLIMYIKQYVV